MSAEWHGRFYWTELMTWNAEKAKAFYAETLGWTYDVMPMAEGGDYIVCKAGDIMAGGIMEMKPGTGFDGLPDHWFAYIAVDDIDARVAQVEAAGGEIMRPPFDVPEVGRIAMVKDAAGAAIGWLTPSDEQG